MSNQKNVMLDAYKSNVSEIDKNAETQKRSANVELQKLLKYLPEYNAARGITGGLAESTVMEAYSKHANRVAGIEADASAQRNTALQNYNKDLQAYKKEQKNEQLENYSLAANTISNWNGSSVGFDDYVKGLEGKVSDEQYNSLLNAYKDRAEVVAEDERNKEVQKKMEKTLYIGESRKVDKLSNVYENQNIKVNLNGDAYNVSVGAEYEGADAGTILQNANAADIGNGEVFYWGGKVYLKYNDKLYTVKDRASDQDFGYQELVDYLRIDQFEQ